MSPYQSLQQLSLQLNQRPFLTQPLSDGHIRVYSYREAFDTVSRLAGGLRQRGLEPGQRIGILSKNCAEWFILDWAAQMAGLITVPLYPTQTAEHLNEALKAVPVHWLFIGKLDDPTLADALEVSHLTTANLPYETIGTDLDWATLTASEPLPETEWVVPTTSDIMTIHFTSGTSGKAQGVKLSYGAYHYACQNTRSAMQVTPEDRFLSYLPAAHIAERMMIQGNAVYSGAQLFFANDLSTFAADLKRAQPTAFMSVPRLWKNFQTAIHAKLPPSLVNALLAIPGVNRLFGRLVRRLLGLSHARLTGSGAAAMPIDLLTWYEKLGIPISEAWGMTETCGLATMNYPFQSRSKGTVGRPVPQTEIRVSHEGELLIRSPGLFSGYFNDDEATTAAFTEEGYFHTGDLGQWQDNQTGWALTGRLRDPFKTSKGKFVNPGPIETRLQQEPLIDLACVFGENQGQPVAAVQLNQPPGRINGLTEILENTLVSINGRLDSHEKLSALLVSDKAWTVESGWLTPTQKVRRRPISEHYQNIHTHPENHSVILIKAPPSPR
ncbi:AMP-binding protein [Reinekea sp. MED297]|uniref:AMP-binding protein n=2 Tax=Reinekea TaxID=230494 RepID=A4BAD0_9GAMM|nr:AMP-binding protein [Reinekea sp. MED297] [Reinekea blandensis MED297]